MANNVLLFVLRASALSRLGYATPTRRAVRRAMIAARHRVLQANAPTTSLADAWGLS